MDACIIDMLPKIKGRSLNARERSLSGSKPDLHIVLPGLATGVARQYARLLPVESSPLTNVEPSEDRQRTVKVYVVPFTAPLQL